MKKMQGFTLIELMIVVAIIAILAAIALPAYQDYVIRSQVSEGSVLSDGAKTAFAEFFSNTGRFPGTNTSAGLAQPASIQGNYVVTLDLSTNVGKITTKFSKTAPQKANTLIDTSLLVFSAITHAGSVAWTCSPNAGSTVLPKYLPTICRQ